MKKNNRDGSNRSYRHFRTLLFALLLGLASSVMLGCGHKLQLLGLTAKTDLALQDESTSPVPLPMLEQAGLRIVWNITHFPLIHNQSVSKIFYHNKKLYLLTDQCKLYALDSNNGTILWSTQLNNTGVFTSGPEFYKDNLILAAGNEIMEIYTANGTTVNSLKLNFAPTTTVPRQKELYFVGGSDSRFHALRRKTGTWEWQSLQPTDPIGKISCSGKNVFFTCTDGIDKNGIYTGGTIYAAVAASRKLLWKKTTRGDLVGVIVDNNRCFVPCTDTALYCFDPVKGELLWRYLSGGALRELPVLTSKYIYQRVDQSSLICLEREPKNADGSLLWELKGGCCMLAENGPLTYAITNRGELTLMNNVSRKRVLSFYIPGMDLFTSNNEDNLLFLASHNGAILVLKPRP